MCLKFLKSKVFSRCRVKFSEGGPVPNGSDFRFKIMPEWWNDPTVQKILQGRLVRLKSKKKSGDKYLRNIILKHGTTGYKCITYGKVDVYAVLEAFEVTCPAVAHAVKKLLCPGVRGGKDAKQDMSEAIDAVSRAIELEEARAALAEMLEDDDPNDSF